MKIRQEEGMWVVRSNDGTAVLASLPTEEQALAPEARSRRVGEGLAVADVRAEQVLAAWAAKQPSADEAWRVSEVFDDTLLAFKDGLFRRVPYTVDADGVTFGAPVELALSL